MNVETRGYKVVSELGAGGMATVYKAIQKSLDRPVAIKELKKAFLADEQIARRFEREARLAASFQHENIVHIYDYWSTPDHCIVMEYVEGADLAEIIEKTGPLPVDVGVMIALQVCSALDYAHMRGLIHRDIKPSNIMIKNNGEAKLMDFGIAYTKALQTLTQPGTMIGTPAYMSPEQILGQPLDHRSDIFSFGIVLYEMFTGVKPFQDEDTRSVSAKIVSDRFSSPRRMNKEIPLRLQRVIKKCLKKKPQKRFQSMLEVARDLGKNITGKTNKSASLKRISDYLVNSNIFSAPPENETIVITRVGMVKTFRNILIGTAAALALLTGAVGYYWWRTSGSASVASPAPATAYPASEPRTAGTVTAPTATAQPSSASAPAASSGVMQEDNKKGPNKTEKRVKKKKRKVSHAR